MSNLPTTSQPGQQPHHPSPTELRSVTLTYLNPKAKHVCVAGDFNNWSTDATPMACTTAGVWCIVLELTPGRHEYRFLVDGRWVSDPSAVSSVRSPLGVDNSVVVA